MKKPTTQMHFHLGHNSEARELVIRYHYSARWPRGVALVGTWHEDGGLFGDSGDAVAACVFGHPATVGWSQPVLELVRLVRHPECLQPLSGLVAATTRAAHKKGWPLLVSYADWTQGHHGGIYQACSWNYHGQRKARVDGLIINSEFVPGRMVNNRFGTQSITKLAAMGIQAEPHFDLGKHLYWHAKGRAGEQMAALLKFNKNPYPKPDSETQSSSD